MANEKRLIYIDDAVKKLEQELDTQCEPETDNDSVNERFIKRVIPKLIRDVINWLKKQPTVDAVEVVHGRWENAGGDLHSSGYAVYCSVCHKNHFVHHKYSLGGLYGCKELFEKPKYCPSCGAVMENEE